MAVATSIESVCNGCTWAACTAKHQNQDCKRMIIYNRLGAKAQLLAHLQAAETQQGQHICVNRIATATGSYSTRLLSSTIKSVRVLLTVLLGYLLLAMGGPIAISKFRSCLL